MRLLIIASFAESLINFRASLISDFQKQGLVVHVAAPDVPPESSMRYSLENMGLIVHEIPLRRTGTEIIADLRLIITLFFIIIKIKPGIVFAYTIKPVVYGIFAAWLARVPRRYSLITGLGYAFTGDMVGTRSHLKKIIESLYRISLRRSDKVFFQNPDDQKLFKEKSLIPHNVPSIVVNGSGVDITTFSRVPFPQSSITFLLIARLLGDKGVREYAQAAAIIKNSFPEVCFSLVGWLDENPDSLHVDELNQWIDSGVIDYLGRLEDVRPAIHDCSVYVLPSYREGTPRSVLEAMAMGRAVITTDAPGCRETVIDGENGFLVPVKSVDALVAAMESFIKEPDLVARMGKRSRQIAEDKYDVHKVNAVMIREMGL